MYYRHINIADWDINNHILSVWFEIVILFYIDMSFSPKQTTSFSVTDILNPIEETYKRTAANNGIDTQQTNNLVSPYGAQNYPTSYPQGVATPATSSSSSAMNGSMAYNYMAAQLGHSTYPSQYCNGAELSAYADPMGQVRNTTGTWYGAGADPRIASKLCFCKWRPR